MLNEMHPSVVTLQPRSPEQEQEYRYAHLLPRIVIPLWFPTIMSILVNALSRTPTPMLSSTAPRASLRLLLGLEQKLWALTSPSWTARGVTK